MLKILKLSLFSIIFLSFLLNYSVLAFDDIEKTYYPFVFTQNTTGLENLSQFQLEYPDSMQILTNKGGISAAMYEELLRKIEPHNDMVKSKADQIVAGRSGALTIDQICAIYDFMRYGNGKKSIGPWNYVLENYETLHYANETLLQGERSHVSGIGDCDDFAIVMASLIQSIGGTTRVNQIPENHLYIEVYLGNLNQDGREISTIVNYLMWNYGINEIYVHVDPIGKDVWLNLDTPLRLGDKAYPGLPFRKSTSQHIIAITSEEDVTPKNRVNNIEGGQLSAPIEESINDRACNGQLKAIGAMLELANQTGIPREEMNNFLRLGIKNSLAVLNNTLQSSPGLPFERDDDFGPIIDLLFP